MNTLLLLALAVSAPKIKETKITDLVGEWVVESVLQSGTPVAFPVGDKVHYEFTKDRTWRTYRGDQELIGRDSQFRVDAKSDPPQLDFVIRPNDPNPSRTHGIFKIEGDTLTICLVHAGFERPTKFESPEGSSQTLYVLKRPKKE